MRVPSARPTPSRRATRRRRRSRSGARLIASMTSLSTIAGATPRRRRRLKMPSSGTGRPYSVRSPNSLRAHEAARRGRRARGRHAHAARARSSGPIGVADQDVRRGPHRQADTRAPRPRRGRRRSPCPSSPGRRRARRGRVGLGVAVLGRVQQGAAEAVTAGPVRDERRVVVAGGDDDLLGGAGRRPRCARPSPSPSRSMRSTLVLHPHVERRCRARSSRDRRPSGRAWGTRRCPRG